MARCTVEELSNINTRNLENIVDELAGILRKLESDDIESDTLRSLGDTLYSLSHDINAVSDECLNAAQEAEDREDSTCSVCGEVGDIDGSGMCSDCHTVDIVIRNPAMLADAINNSMALGDDEED